MILSTRNNKICINLFDLLIKSILFSTNLEFGSKFYHNVVSSPLVDCYYLMGLVIQDRSFSFFFLHFFTSHLLLHKRNKFRIIMITYNL